MRLMFVSCCKKMKAIQAIKITMVFIVIPLNNADSVLTARQYHCFCRLGDLASCPSMFGIIKRITCLSQFELCFET